MLKAPAKRPAKKQDKYTYDQALEASTSYFREKLPASIWTDKYAMRDSDNNLLELTPDDMHDRLAGEFARIDAEKYGLDYDVQYKLYRDALHLFARVVPQGSPMCAIGNTHQIMSASNCVVVESPEDSIAGIMKTGTELAQLYKRRCGCGVDLSTLRPEGAKVNNASRSTTGAWSFADYYSYITRMIGQAGRRGALMLTLDVHHPDVIKFATMKADLQKVTGANVSVRLSDAFLKAVDEDTEYEQYWPMEGPKQYSKMVKAKDVWKIIIDVACRTAEPGLIFWDRMTQFLPAHSYKQFRSRSCNPCAEISLSAYDSCRLISLNLTGYVRNAFTKPSFDWDLFTSDIKLATQMCDNLVDLELELIEKIKTACDGKEEKELWQKLWQAGHDGRRTGLGTHGVADALAQMNIKYDSEEALEMVDKIYSALCHTAYETSTELAKIRGPFAVWDWAVDKDNKFIQSLPDWLQAKIKKDGRRNIAMLTQAPTGSVSIVSKCGEFARWNVSSGVEPVFRNFYIRRKKINPNDKARVDYKDALGDTWQEYPVFHPNVKNYLEKVRGYSLTTSDDAFDDITIKKLKEEKLPEYFTTSDQIDWKYRIQLQAREQLMIDHSISSTLNLPKGTTSDTVGNIYLAGWKQGLKGITVYVDGARQGVLITESEKSSKIDPTIRPEKIVVMSAPKRPKTLPCDIHQVTVDGKRWTTMVGLLHGVPYEVFLGYSEQLHLPTKIKTGNITKTGKGKYQLHVGEGDDELIIKDIINVFDNPQSAWATRLLSMSLRHGISTSYLSDVLSKDGKINDINRVIARVLKKYIPDGEKVTLSTACTNCKGTNLKYQEGCVSCIDCGNSKCN
jgi:ribonucleoside-diphosphate reductase alpha chain